VSFWGIFDGLLMFVLNSFKLSIDLLIHLLVPSSRKTTQAKGACRILGAWIKKPWAGRTMGTNGFLYKQQGDPNLPTTSRQNKQRFPRISQ
jgi:hypothetical protein